MLPPTAAAPLQLIRALPASEIFPLYTGKFDPTKSSAPGPGPVGPAPLPLTVRFEPQVPLKINSPPDATSIVALLDGSRVRVAVEPGNDNAPLLTLNVPVNDSAVPVKVRALTAPRKRPSAGPTDVGDNSLAAGFGIKQRSRTADVDQCAGAQRSGPSAVANLEGARTNCRSPGISVRPGEN